MPDTMRRRELARALQAKVAEIDNLANAWKVEGDNDQIVISTEQHAAYLAAVAEAEQIKTLLDAQTRSEDLHKWLKMPEGDPAAAADQVAAAQQQLQTKSLATHLMESEDFKAKAAERWQGDPYLRVQIDRSIDNFIAYKDLYTASGGSVTVPAMPSIQQLPPAELARRQRHVRDLFPKATTTAAVLYGIRETGWVDNAAQVPQRTQPDGSPAVGDNTDVFGHKPKSDLQLTPVMYPVGTIAHTIDIHKSTLDDAPRLADFVNRRMVDGVMYAEDDTLLFGTPGGENVTGIFNTPGIQYYTGLSADKYSVQIRRAATRVMLAEYQATGIVLNPLDWEAIETETDNVGAFRVAVSVAVGAEMRVWRLDVVETTAMPQGRYLVGAFGMGSQVYDRQQLGVVLSTENKDNFERNVVSVRAEERLAYEVSRPASHVAGTFTTPA